MDILHLRPKRRCSWHNHQTKYNQFYVIEGEIVIKTEWGAAGVKKGQIFTVKPGDWHEFQTGEKPAIVQEIMYVDYDADDICRDTLGGPLEEPTICLDVEQMWKAYAQGGHQ